jgi:hypothetical protein
MGGLHAAAQDFPAGATGKVDRQPCLQRNSIQKRAATFIAG